MSQQTNLSSQEKVKIDQFRELSRERIEPVTEYQPEKEFKRQIEKEVFKEKTVSSPTSPLALSKFSAIPVIKSERLQQIEKILEEDLGEIYRTLDGPTKQLFKAKGEETAFFIEKLVENAKVKIKKILHLIINWLKIIPGINRFFLEQEAKIKTGKIMALRENKK